MAIIKAVASSNRSLSDMIYYVMNEKKSYLPMVTVSIPNMPTWKCSLFRICGIKQRAGNISNL